MLHVNNASFGYQRNKMVLKNINLQLAKGQVLAVLGPNGVGKTTMLKCIMNLHPWTTGACLLNGTPVAQISVQSLWRTIAYVPQAKQGVFAYSAEEMILLGRSAHIGLFAQPGKPDIAMVEEVMEMIGILHLRGKLCTQMSGGELQMVLMARALIARPQILVLDEPESNLDFKNQLIVLETIHTLATQQGIACLFNTHYPAHALKVGTHALMLNRSGQSLYGTVADIVTEDNLKSTFDVSVHIHDVDIGTEHHRSVIPLEIIK